MYQKTTLDNGLRIVSESIPYMSSVSIGIFVGTGSRAENLPEQGVSHFIEHLMFKGTKKRSARDIAEAVDDIGGQLNAATDRENTCYYIKVLPEHLDLGLDILSDMLLYSQFPDSELEKERQVILEEISLYEDSPDELIHDLHMNALWPGHALGRHERVQRAVSRAQGRVLALRWDLAGLQLLPSPEDIASLRADGYLADASKAEPARPATQPGGVASALTGLLRATTEAVQARTDALRANTPREPAAPRIPTNLKEQHHERHDDPWRQCRHNEQPRNCGADWKAPRPRYARYSRPSG